MCPGLEKRSKRGQKESKREANREQKRQIEPEFRGQEKMAKRGKVGLNPYYAVNLSNNSVEPDTPYKVDHCRGVGFEVDRN